MDPKTAFAMLLGAQGFPPEATELLFDKIEDLNELLLSAIARNRAEALRAKLEVWRLLQEVEKSGEADAFREFSRAYFEEEENETEEPKGTDA